MQRGVNPENVVFVNILAAPEGIKAFSSAYPTTKILSERDVMRFQARKTAAAASVVMSPISCAAAITFFRGSWVKLAVAYSSLRRKCPRSG